MMPPTFRTARQQEARRAQAVEVDRHRGSARERGYTTSWDKASRAHLAEHPFCGYCEAGALGPVRVSPANLVDHLYPQRAYPGVFWRRAWWVSCCADCHNGPKQSLERAGRAALDDLARRLGLEPLAD